MQIPNLPNGHLYQYLTVLGAFLLFLSCYTMAQVVSSHNSLFRKAVEEVLLNESVKPELREFWQSQLLSSKKDTIFLIGFFTATGVIGIAVAIFGIAAWYRKIQKYEDTKRDLENRKLDHELKSQIGKDKPQLIT